MGKAHVKSESYTPKVVDLMKSVDDRRNLHFVKQLDLGQPWIYKAQLGGGKTPP